ncbi:hypothetical protein LJC42_01680 [Eubacteriales bacterium OttesenSCG-928-K08]|nr:hypothetical protein [Eubacteriales bacterium OttesenSCG-928-K08]
MDEKLEFQLGVDASGATTGAGQFSDALGQTTRTVKTTQQEISKLEAELRKLSQEYDQQAEKLLALTKQESELEAVLKNSTTSTLQRAKASQELFSVQKQIAAETPKMKQLETELNRLSDKFGEAEPAIKKTGSTMTATGNAAAKTSQQVGTVGSTMDQAVEKLKVSQQVYDSIAQKLQQASLQYDRQAEKILKLMNEETKLEAIIQSGTAGIEKRIQANQRLIEVQQQIAAETPEMKRLEGTLNDLTDKMSLMDPAGQRVSRTMTSMGAQAASTAAQLAGGNSSLSGAISTMGQSIYAISAGISPWIIGISAAMAAIKLITGSVEDLNKFIVEQIELLHEQRDALQASTEKLTQAKAAFATYTSATASADELTAAQQKLVNTYPDLIKGINEEGEAVIVTTETIDLYIKKMDEADRKARQRQANKAKTLFEEEAKAAIDAAKDVEKLTKQMDEYKKTVGELGVGTIQKGGGLGFDLIDQNAIDDLQVKLDEAESLWEEYRDNAIANIIDQYTATVELTGEQTLIVQDRLQNFMEQNKEALTSGEAAVHELLTNSFGAIGEILETAGVSVDEFTEKLENATKVDFSKQAEQALKLDSVSKAAKKIADEFGNAKKGSDEYTQSSERLKRVTGLTRDEIEAAYGSIESFANAMGEGAAAAAGSLSGELKEAIAEMILTGETASLTADEITELLGKLREAGLFDEGGGKRSDGGSSRKKAWEEELALIERVRDVEAEYTDEYVAHIEYLLSLENVSAEQRKRLEKELGYAKQGVTAELNDSYISFLENLLRAEKLTADQRLEIERKLFEAKYQYQQQALASYQDFGNAVVDALRNRYQAELDAQVNALNAQISAVQAAAKKQTAAVQAAADERIKAIQDEIRALDDLLKARTRANQDEADEDKLAHLKEQLKYEKDLYNQQKLQEQIAQLEKEMEERHWREGIQDQKEELNDQISLIRDETKSEIALIQARADKEVEILRERIASVQAYYAERLNKQRLYHEAEYMLQNASEEEIIELLKSYNQDYLLAGSALGQNLYDGLKVKLDAMIQAAKDAAAEIARIMAGGNPGGSGSGGDGSDRYTPVTDTFAAFAQHVTEPARRYYADRAGKAGMKEYALADFDNNSNAFGYNNVQTTENLTPARSVKVDQTVVIQSPTPSTYQVAQALRRESEKLASMI